MCGIAGIVGDAGPDGPEPALRTMMKTMAHRGPDDEGLWLDPAGGCGFGHKRLAIIDPENGRQPMSNEDGSVWITFNGCIYNYQDIQRTLRERGHRFRTHCDTEAIIHAYEEWGPDCVERFNGMWAFAIWDTRRRTLFASRDRIGVKPFYYVLRDGTLTFASEIKALTAAGAVRPRIDVEGLRQYLTFQYCLDDRTLFEGVRNLPPGHSLLLRPGEAPQVRCFWDLAFPIEADRDEDWFVERLARLLEDAVRLRLRSDVPLGTHLSGGLDSSTVTALARLLLGDAPLKSFTGAFRDGPAFDETRYARIASAAAGTDYHEIYLGASDLADSIERIIWHMDQPAAGPGGDEIFIGYARYLIAYLEECLRGAIENTAHRASYVATLETIVPSLPTLEAYVPMLKTFWSDGLFDPPARRYFALMNRFADSRAMLSGDLRFDMERTFEEFQAVYQTPGPAAMINRILRYDLKTHLQSLLQVEDRTSMAWGLESRVPLLDYRLVELMASVPPVVKFRNGRLKHLFRRAVRNLVPPEIYNRTDKMGFPVPFAQWARGQLRPMIADVLLSRTCRQRGLFDVQALERMIETSGPFSRSIWGALCLELWHRLFIDRSPAA